MSCYLILSWSFPGVLGIFTSIIILGNVHRPCKQFPNLVNTCLHHASSFSPHLAWFSDYICVDYHIWKMCTDHVNTTPTLLTTVYIMSILFLLSFSDFLVIFLLITMLGTAHRPCKQYTSIVDNDLHLSLNFSWFSDYIYINYHIRKCAQTM